MDVRNFQREEKVRKAESLKRIAEHRQYLDQQVTQKAKEKKAARQADLSWGVEIKKDYNKWQEENIVAEAKAHDRKQRYVRETDQQLAEVEARRAQEIQKDMDFDKRMLARVQEEMMREKEKLEQKKAEEAKLAEMMRVQNDKMKLQREEAKMAQGREEVRLQKQYAEILLKQERAHKAKQKAFMKEIERKASRFDAMAAEERRKQGEKAAMDADAEKKAIEDAKEQYRKEMIDAAQKEKE